MVELAKVLTLEECIDGDLVILLDEPTSVLAKKEVSLLFELVRELRSRASFIFASHRLDEVIEISDRIYVMKDGEVVDEVASANAVPEAIQHKMVSREISKGYYRETARFFATKAKCWSRPKEFPAPVIMRTFPSNFAGEKFSPWSASKDSDVKLCCAPSLAS